MSNATKGGSGETPSMRNMSLEDATKLSIELLKPLAEVNKVIQNNISTVKGKLDEIVSIGQDRADLANMAKTTTTKLIVEKLDKPQTICGSFKCMGTTTSKSGKKIEDYNQICHERCFLTGVDAGFKNQEELRECDAMIEETTDPICRHCSCSWKEHMHREYKTIQKEEEVEDADIKVLIKTTKDNNELVKVVTESLKGKIDVLEGEQKVVTEVSAQVATFLEQNNNSIDVKSGYLDHQIDVQENLVALGNSRDLLDRMMTTRSRYADELDFAGKVSITPENILDSVKKLCNLPETGDQIKRTIEAVTSVDISGGVDSVGDDFSGLNVVE